MTYEEYKLAKQGLTRIVNDQIKVIGRLDYNPFAKGNGSTSGHSLNETLQALENENLNALVMGCFSAGKSEFLNALMGQALLPTGILPVTAIIGEIIYGEDWNITLYPKNDERPIQIPKETLFEYITIDNFAEEKNASPYKLLSVQAPLDICKNGVRLIDSPGLNDPDAYEEVTLDFLPSADAIIYLIADFRFTATDKNTLKFLNDCQYKSILFVIPKIDMLPGHEAEQVKKALAFKLSPFTDLGPESIQFVNSKGAKEAKMAGQPVPVETGFPQLELELERVLANERGRMKLRKALYQTRIANRETARHIDDRLQLAAQDMATMQTRIQQAQKTLQQAEAKGQSILSTIIIKLHDVKDDTETLIRSFLDETIQNIDGWMNDMEVTSEFSHNPFKLKQEAAAYTKEVDALLKVQFENAFAAWNNDALRPFLEKEMNRIGEEADADMKLYVNDLAAVRVDLGLLSAEEMMNNAIPDNTSRFVMVSLSILLLNPAFAYGAMFGKRAFFASIAATAILSLIVALIFGPFGLIGALIIGLIGTLIGKEFGQSNREEKIKKMIAENMKKALRGELIEMGKDKQKINVRQQIVDTIKNYIGSEFSKIEKVFRENLGADINEYRILLDEAQKMSDNAGLQETTTALREFKVQNDKVSALLDEIGMETDL